MIREALPRMMLKNLLVPMDFSDHAEHALDYACELADKLGSTIYLVTAIGAATPELAVTFTGAMFESMRRDQQAALQKLIDARPGVRFGRTVISDDDPRDAILAAVETVQADLIVMGTHGRRGIKRVLLGSVAENVVRRASCPVLTLQAPGEQPEPPVERPSHSAW